MMWKLASHTLLIGTFIQMVSVVCGYRQIPAGIPPILKGYAVCWKR